MKKIAQIKNPALGEGLQAKTGNQFFSDTLPSFVGIAFVIGVLIFLFTLIAGAISWMTSGGDKQSVETARGRITSALTGLIILFAALAIIKVIEEFFGINILTLDIMGLEVQ